MNNELMHYGVLGQKWGIRRYQNEDGSYKPNARGRYNEDGGQITKSGKYKASNGLVVAKSRNRGVDAMRRISTTGVGRLATVGATGSTKEKINKERAALKEYYKNGGDKMFDQTGKSGLSDNQKKALKIGAAVVGTALVAYGGYKVAQVVINTKATKILEDLYLRDAQREVNTLSDQYKEFLTGKGALANLGVKSFSYKVDPSEYVENARKAARSNTTSQNYNIIRNTSKATKDRIKKEGVTKVTGLLSASATNKNLGRVDDALAESVKRAREAGVPESQIIKTLEEGHKYFKG